MAAITLLDSTPDTGTAPNTGTAYTPTAGRLQFVVMSQRGTNGDNLTHTITNSAGLTFTQVTAANATYPTTPGNIITVWVADALTSVTSSQTITLTDTVDNAAGTIISVFEISGMTKTGLTAIKQAAAQNDKGTGDTAEIVFGASCLTGNPTIFAEANSTNPSGVVEPSGWTELVDNGHLTPNHGQHVSIRNSGFTGTTITAGSTYPNGGAALGVEFDASASSSTAALAHYLNSIRFSQ